jgi:hypothetical protein
MASNQIAMEFKVVDFLSFCSGEPTQKNVEIDFHINHPRFKALDQMEGEILDIGAGDGGMGQLMSWPVQQIGKKLVGCDLNAPINVPAGYAAWISGGFKSIPIEKKYGGVFAIHLLEHLYDWEEMLDNASKNLKENGLIFIEWPSTETTHWPSASSVWARFIDLHPEFSTKLLTTFNFYDDDTHVIAPPQAKEVISRLREYDILESGTIFLPNVAPQLVTKGIKENSIASVTMGVWAQFGFAQYLLARKRKV